VLASDGLKYLIGMSFPSPFTRAKSWASTAISLVAAFVTPGVRSVLGNFLMTHDLNLQQGLMAGALSTSWPLLDLADETAA